MEAERQRLAELEAEADAEGWHSIYQQTTAMIETNERMLKNVQEQNPLLRTDALREIDAANRVKARAADLRKVGGDPVEEFLS